MIKVALGEIADIVSGATPRSDVDDYWGGNVQWVTPADLSGLAGAYISTTPRTLTDSGLRSCSAAVLPPGSVLLSSRAPIGHVAITGAPMATNQGFKSLIPRQDRADAKYLYHWLRANKALLQSLGNGATFKEISKAVVARVEVPLPPIEEQRRIAAILDQADALRAKRRQVLAYLNSVTGAVFDTTFPVASSSQQIGAVGRVTTGRTPPTALDGMFDGPVPFVTPGDLGSGAGVVRSLTLEGAKLSRRVRPGATLVCCIGATIGKVGVATLESAFNQQINAIEWDSNIIEDSYGLEAIRRLKPVIVARGASTTLPLLPKGQFVKLQIPVPRMEDQRRFSARVSQIDLQRARVERALNRDDQLFAALQSRAFRGEL